MHAWWISSALAICAVAGTAFAQTAGAPVPSMPATIEAPLAPTPPLIRVPAGTLVQVEITEALSSETSQQQQLFALRLAAPIMIDGREVVPAGVIGGGEVIDAHPSAFGGRQGRLILSGRFLEIGGQRVRIRTFQLSEPRAGEDRAVAAVTTAIVVGIPAFLIQGGEVRIPPGTRATARIAVDVDIPIEPAAPAAEAATTTEVVQQPAEGESQQ